MLTITTDERARRKQLAKATTRQAISRSERLIAASKARIARAKVRRKKAKKKAA